MRAHAILCGLALVASGVVAQSLDARALPLARRVSILTAVRAYVDASNRVDVQAMIDSYSKSPNVSSATLGEIRRGWEAIRAEADSAAGMEGLMRISLGAVDVTALEVVPKPLLGRSRGNRPPTERGDHEGRVDRRPVVADFSIAAEAGGEAEGRAPAGR